ncbi:unknown [Bacteroides sp. CAG:709]|nr:unknown [Bacteroides sp. CAG:709]
MSSCPSSSAILAMHQSSYAYSNVSDTASFFTSDGTKPNSLYRTEPFLLILEERTIAFNAASASNPRTPLRYASAMTDTE